MTKQKTLVRGVGLLLAAALLLTGALVRLLGSGMPMSLWVYARGHGYSAGDYPKEIVSLYRRNSDAREFVRSFPALRGSDSEIDLSGEITSGKAPLLMQWDPRWGCRRYNENWMALSGCGPTCLSMAAIAITGDTSMDPWAMAQFAENNGFNVVGQGTAWALFTDGAAMLGLDSTQITMDEQRVMDNLAVGNPIVCVVGPGDFTTEGHFILLAGLEDGLIRVNDPNSVKNSGKLWSFEQLAPQVQALWVLR